jgi:hypothetical protein
MITIRELREAKKVKAGKGNMHIDIDPSVIPDKFVGPKWMGQMEKKHGMMIRYRKDSYVISGQKKGIVSFVTTELDWDQDDIENMWPELLESAAINERVSGRDTVWDSDQREVIDYMLKDRRFGLHAATFGYEDGENIYFDDDALVFNATTVATTKANTTVDDLIKAVLKRKKLPKHPNWTPAFAKELKRKYG